MFVAVALACSLLLASSSGKTVETLDDRSVSTSTQETSRVTTVADQATALLKEVLKGVGGDTAEHYGSLLLPTLLRQLPHAEGLKTMLTNGLGVHEDFLRVFSKIFDGMNKLEAFPPKSLDVGMTFPIGNDIVSNEYSNDDVLGNSTTGGTDVNSQYLNLIKNVFQEEFGSFPQLPVVSKGLGDTSDSQGSLGMTTSSIWMLIKSTWQRILAYVEDENALPHFMQLTPVKIIDRLLHLGDDLNLINFLAQKLDQDFAEFVAEEVTPYLGPLKDFDSFYNFTKENGFSGVLDYFRSRNFGYTMTAMSRFISAYFDDTFSDDVADQYIAFISFGNTDLYNFYKSLLQTQRRTADGGDPGRGRFKRENLNRMIGDYKFTGYDFQQEAPGVDAGRDLSRDGGYGGHSGGGGGYGSSGGYGGGYGHGGGGGGHGGGGYGYGSGYGGGYGHGGGGYGDMMIDPAVVLSSVAIGALLGFLLFRLIRGTGNGRRDIGDGSLSLWLSDMPDKLLPWGSSVERMKRHVQNFNTTGGDEFNLPDSLRGDVWSTDPLVGDNLLDDEYEEDDIADHLNQLWRVYKQSNEAACVQSHLCGVMTNSTAEQLTGKDSSLPLIMASVSNLMGVAGPGQLVDEIVHTMVVGNQYTCPGLSHCHHPHLLL